jgi:uncharacterized protein involved in exopolysaccharide biosynthesis
MGLGNESYLLEYFPNILLISPIGAIGTFSLGRLFTFFRDRSRRKSESG